ncbi:hypothetical protein [Haloarcula sp. CGMCC 1.2071]|uniref:hypothetical protein n=1 Tax=Haloarcula sp. CGMCC 1.2071 TaxID=3111454 RepID=UPI00300EE1B1
MSATVFLDSSMDGDTSIECTTAKVMGNVVWAVPEDDGRERVVPLSNVTGLAGDVVEQEVDEVEYPGGRVTELVTHLS